MKFITQFMPNMWMLFIVMNIIMMKMKMMNNHMFKMKKMNMKTKKKTIKW